MTLASRLLESALEGLVRKAAQERRGPLPEARPDEGRDQGQLVEHDEGSGDGHYEEELDDGESGAVGESDRRRDHDWFFDPRPDDDPQAASVPGRALARATALDVLRSPQTGPSQVTVVGDGIRSVSCASPGAGVLTPCGTEGKGRWTVLLRGAAREAAVVAQVDLS